MRSSIRNLPRTVSPTIALQVRRLTSFSLRRVPPAGPDHALAAVPPQRCSYSGRLAFLDEEQEGLVVVDEPKRPRRRVGGPQRRRQQFLVRRLIGVGVGLAFLILIVIGIRGCLEARSDRGLRNYASDVATIMQQSEQSGTDFFDLLNSPSGGSSSLDVKNQILAQRDNSQTLLDRAENL